MRIAPFHPRPLSALPPTVRGAQKYGRYGSSRANFTELFDGPPSTTCTAPSHEAGVLSSVRRALRSTGDDDKGGDASIMAHHAWYLVPVVIICLLIGFIMIQCIRHFAKVFVYASMIWIPLSLVASGTAITAGGGSIYAALVIFAFAALWCLLIFCWRDGLRLTAALLEQAATVLVVHSGILIVGAILVLCYLLVLSAGATGFVYLLANGQWVYPTMKIPSAHPDCVWEPTSFAYIGMGVLGLWLLWAAMLAQTIQTFVASLVTACWYFDASSIDTGSADSIPDAVGAASARRAPVRAATRIALTLSLGTLCFSSAVLVVCNLLRAAARSAQRNSDNYLVVLAACCLQCLLDCVEFLNKFAVVMHAITGDDFCTSGRSVTTLLKRHGLNAWFVDRIAAFVLGMTTVAFAGLAGGATYVTLISTLNSPGSVEHRQVVAGVFAGAAGAIGFLILTFTCSFINTVVDASYTCLALDFDAGAPHQPPLRDALIPIVKPDYVVVVGQPVQPGVATATAVPVGQTVVPIAQPMVNPVGAGAQQAVTTSHSPTAQRLPPATAYDSSSTPLKPPAA